MGSGDRRPPVVFARALARRGLLVFPLAAGKKHPPLVKFKAAASCANQQVRKFWTRHPTANIGVHCADLLVLDIDPKRGGDAALDELRVHGELPATFTVRTPSGGEHRYFRAEGGVPNSVDRLAPGIDVRSNGGYVVGPGSRTPAGEYTVSDPSPVAEAPAWLIGAYLERLRPTERRQEPVPVGQGDLDPEKAVAKARHWLRSAQPAIEGQGGDVLTFQTVCRVRDFGVPEDRALEVLEGWNARCEPPWEPEELQRKIDNAYRYAQNPFGVDSPDALFEPVPEEDRGPPPKPEPPIDETIYGPDDVDLDRVLNTRYLVKHWLNAQTQALMFGHYGAGKTFLALHLAACLAAGKEWFGRRVTQCGVLYAGYEGEAAMGRRLYALRREYPDWDMSRFAVRGLRYAIAPPNGGEERTKGQAELEAALRVFRRRHGQWPGLVIIDPLRNALGGSDSDPTLTTAYLNYANRIARATGATVLTVHHPGHGDQERSRGDSAIESFMDTVIRIDHKRGIIESAKQRDEATDSTFYRLKIVSLGKDQDGEEQTTCVAEEVSMNPMDPALTDSQRDALLAARELLGEDAEFSKTDFKTATPALTETVRNEILLTLVQKGYIERDGRKYRFAPGNAQMFDSEA